MIQGRLRIHPPDDLTRLDLWMAGGSGVLLFLSFPDASLAPLAWIALIPLLLAAGRHSPRQAFLLGWGGGAVAYLGILYWLNVVMTTYGRLPLVASLLLHLILSLYLGMYVGLSLMVTRWGELRGVTPALTLPVAWVAGEYVRTYLLTGFPWALVGYSQYRILPVIQIADITGVYGVGFLVLMTNAVGYLVFRVPLSRAGDRYPVKSAALLALFLFASVYYGLERLDDIEEGSVMRVLLVQGNIPQDVKWAPDFKEATIRIYERLTNEGTLHGTDLVVWPESALPTFYQDDLPAAARLRRLCRELETHLLFGSPAYERRKGKNRFLNSAFLIDAGGNDVGRSDKVHLVPFGEYVPLAPLLPFVDKMVEGIGDFVPGDGIRPLHHPRGDLGVLVCFEGIFPDIARSYVRAGARLLVNVTNDAWFGRSSAPAQHLSKSVFRAIENRTPVARAANTGISAFVTVKGEIEQSTPLFTEAVVRSELRLGTGRLTVYSRVGDLFARLDLLALVGVVAYGVGTGGGGRRLFGTRSWRGFRRGI